jgi:ketosteroid isomerase-like protein
MSQDKVEVVVRWFELLGRGEAAAALQYVDPAVETHEGPELPGAGTYFGHAGLAKAYNHWADQWDDFHIKLVELVEADRDVVAVTRHHGTGRASGVPVQTLVAYVLTLDDGKLVRVRIFDTKAQALEAVGLRE